jgi:sporulation protein YlmC with PRC-barrel domain
MKKLILSGAIAAITGLAIASAIAQTQSTTTQTTTTGYIQSSSVLGAKIKDSRGQDVGEIKDFVLDRNTGCLAYVVVSTGKGGVLSTSTKTVAAPWSVFSSSSDPRVYTTRVERERIYSAPVWESTRIDEYSRTDYLNNVYGYYGVPAPRFGMEMNIGTSTSGINTTGTGASTTTSTGSAASTYATASPAASVGASPSAFVSESTPAASATPRSTTSPMGTPMRNPASKATTPKTSASASGSSSSSTSQDASGATSTKAERVKKSEKTSTKSEATSEKPESAPGDSPSSKSSKTSKHKTAEPGSTPDAASTPQE